MSPLALAARVFGGDLRGYIDQYSLATLASCMLSKPRFRPAALMSNPDDLEKLLGDIIAGGQWPFDPSDLTPFIETVIACVRGRSTTRAITLKLAGVTYSRELGP